MSKPRLAVVASHVIQHFAPVYQEIEKSGSVDLRVFFIAENGARDYQDKGFGHSIKWDIALTQGYEHEFLEPGKILDQFTFGSIDSKRIVPALKGYKPDFIWLHGYAARANWRVLVRNRSMAKLIYTSDSNPADKRAMWRKAAKYWGVRYFFNQCHHFLSISPANRQYLESYGVTPDKIINSRFPVDMDRLIAARDQIDDTQILQLREQLGIPPMMKTLLFAGKLVEHKCPLDVLKVLLEPGMEQLRAIMIGSGEQNMMLQEFAQQYAIRDRVHFTGFLNQSELAQYFKLADLFVFPSAREPYGAVATETLPFGLPIVSADGIGAIGDSIVPGRNALLFAAGDIPAMAHCIRTIIESPELEKDYSEYSTELAQQHDKSVMARDIIQICTS